MKFSGAFVVVTALFVTVLLVSNIIAVKLIHVGTLPFQFLGSDLLFLPAGIVIFPVSYIIGDVLTEVYGFKLARGVIWLGFVCNALGALFIWLGGLIPAEIFWADQEAYDAILGQARWVLLGSFAAYLVGEFANSMVLARLKHATEGRYLWLRTVSSTCGWTGIRFLRVHIHRFRYRRRPAHRPAIPDRADPMGCQDRLRSAGHPLDLRGGHLSETQGATGRLRPAGVAEPTVGVCLASPAQFGQRIHVL